MAREAWETGRLEESKETGPLNLVLTRYWILEQKQDLSRKIGALFMKSVA